jgi:hypothetical protein
MAPPREAYASLAAAELFAASAVEEEYYTLPDEDNYLVFDDEDYIGAYISAMDGDCTGSGFEEAGEEYDDGVREFELTQWSKAPERAAAAGGGPSLLTRAYATPEAALAKAAAAVLLLSLDS